MIASTVVGVILLVHRACGHPAFRYARLPRMDEPIFPELVRLLDGSVPSGGTPVLCGSCGAPIVPSVHTLDVRF